MMRLRSMISVPLLLLFFAATGHAYIQLQGEPLTVCGSSLVTTAGIYSSNGFVPYDIAAAYCGSDGTLYMVLRDGGLRYRVVTPTGVMVEDAALPWGVVAAPANGPPMVYTNTTLYTWLGGVASFRVPSGELLAAGYTPSPTIVLRLEDGGLVWTPSGSIAIDYYPTGASIYNGRVYISGGGGVHVYDVNLLREVETYETPATPGGVRVIDGVIYVKYGDAWFKLPGLEEVPGEPIIIQGFGVGFYSNNVTYMGTVIVPGLARIVTGQIVFTYYNGSTIVYPLEKQLYVSTRTITKIMRLGDVELPVTLWAGRAYILPPLPEQQALHRLTPLYTQPEIHEDMFVLLSTFEDAGEFEGSVDGGPRGLVVYTGKAVDVRLGGVHVITLPGERAVMTDNYVAVYMNGSIYIYDLLGEPLRIIPVEAHEMFGVGDTLYIFTVDGVYRIELPWGGLEAVDGKTVEASMGAARLELQFYRDPYTGAYHYTSTVECGGRMLPLRYLDSDGSYIYGLYPSGGNEYPAILDVRTCKLAVMDVDEGVVKPGGYGMIAVDEGYESELYSLAEILAPPLSFTAEARRGTLYIEDVEMPGRRAVVAAAGPAYVTVRAEAPYSEPDVATVDVAVVNGTDVTLTPRLKKVRITVEVAGAVPVERVVLEVNGTRVAVENGGRVEVPAAPVEVRLVAAEPFNVCKTVELKVVPKEGARLTLPCRLAKPVVVFKSRVPVKVIVGNVTVELEAGGEAVRPLPPGVYNVTAIPKPPYDERYSVYIGRLELEEPRLVELDVTPPPKAMLSVTAVPEGALVTVYDAGGRVVATASAPASFSLDAGNYTVRVEAEGYRPRTVTVTLEPGEDERLRVSLEPVEEGGLPLLPIAAAVAAAAAAAAIYTWKRMKRRVGEAVRE